jgi:hypothetical protein
MAVAVRRMLVVTASAREASAASRDGFGEGHPCRLNDENSRAKVQNVRADSSALCRALPDCFGLPSLGRLW